MSDETQAPELSAVREALNIVGAVDRLCRGAVTAHGVVVAAREIADAAKKLRAHHLEDVFTFLEDEALGDEAESLRVELHEDDGEGISEAIRRAAEEGGVQGE